MGEELSDDVMKSTQTLLGKYVTKPTLTDKLLKKPPFRFIHDIINAVVKDTGYLKGLFTDDELTSANVKEREAKNAFLNKLISAVKTTTKIELKVRASKVIAGLEPQETNKLLQAIASAIDQKIDATEYINSLAGKSKDKVDKSKDKTNKSKDKTDKSKDKLDKVKVDTKIKESRSTSKSTLKSDESKTKSKVSKSRTSLEKESLPSSRTKKVSDVKTPKEKKTSNIPEKKISSTRKSDSNRTPKTTPSTNREKEQIKTEQKVQEEIPIQKQDITPRENINSKIENPVDNLIGESIIKSKDSTPRVEEEKIEQINLEVDKLEDSILVEEKEEIVVKNDILVKEVVEERRKSSAKIERPKTGKINRKIIQPIEEIKNEIVPEIVKDIPQAPITIRPRSSLRPPSVRPSSARPGAPRLRPDSALPMKELVPLGGKINVIVENFSDNGQNGNVEDDEETVVIEHTSPEDQILMLTGNNDPDIGNAANSKSHLVEQILQEVGDDATDGPSTTNSATIINPALQDKGVMALSGSIQTVTQSANTLGKLMGYLHEDVDAMHAELEMWTNMTRITMLEAERKRQELQESTKPLRKHLQEIEESIKKQKEEISVLQYNIYTDHLKIESLINKSISYDIAT